MHGTLLGDDERPKDPQLADLAKCVVDGHDLSDEREFQENRIVCSGSYCKRCGEVFRHIMEGTGTYVKPEGRVSLSGRLPRPLYAVWLLGTVVPGVAWFTFVFISFGWFDALLMGVLPAIGIGIVSMMASDWFIARYVLWRDYDGEVVEYADGVAPRDWVKKALLHTTFLVLMSFFIGPLGIAMTAPEGVQIAHTEFAVLMFMPVYALGPIVWLINFSDRRYGGTRWA